MSRLSDLLRQVNTIDESVAKDLQREVDALAGRRAFGLNFERHVPESVELPGRKVRKGDKVHILPERGKNPTAENDRLWRVTSIDRDAGSAVAELEDPKDNDPETREVTSAAVEDLVVVAEFRDPIYPGLVSTGKVERGGEKPFHTVINAENFHALQTCFSLTAPRSTASISTRPTTPGQGTGSTTTTMSKATTSTVTRSGWLSWSADCYSRRSCSTPRTRS